MEGLTNLNFIWLWASTNLAALGSSWVLGLSLSSGRGRLSGRGRGGRGRCLLLRLGRGRGRGVGRGHGLGLVIFLVGLSPCLAGPALYYCIAHDACL